MASYAANTCAVFMLCHFLGRLYGVKTTDEMLAHKHNASSSLAGEHTHTINVITRPNDQNAGDGGSNYWADRQTSAAGNHTHDINVDSTGGNNKHENRPPYTVGSRWKRVS